MTERTVNSWTSTDGRSRARLFQRPDGFYGYVIEAQAYEERPAIDEQGFGYWRTIRRSGPIAGFAQAQDEVLAQLSWLADDAGTGDRMAP